MWLAAVSTFAAVAASVIITGPSFDLDVLGARAIVLAMAFFFLNFLGTIITHEVAHLMIARSMGSFIYSAYCRPGAAGITFSERRTLARLGILAAGPVAGILVLGIVLVSLFRSPDEFWAVAGIDQLRLSLVVAITTLCAWQLMCFTPLTADGRQLFIVFRELGRAGKIAGAGA